MTSSVLILHLNSSFYIDDIATIEHYHAMNSKVKIYERNWIILIIIRVGHFWRVKIVLSATEQSISANLF